MIGLPPALLNRSAVLQVGHSLFACSIDALDILIVSATGVGVGSLLAPDLSSELYEAVGYGFSG